MKLFKLYNSDLSNKSYTSFYDYWSESLTIVLSTYFQEMLDDWSQWTELVPYDGLEFTLCMIDTDQAGADFLLYEPDDIAQDVLSITLKIEKGSEEDDVDVYYLLQYQERNTIISETDLLSLINRAKYEGDGTLKRLFTSNNIVYKSPSLVVDVV
mgnify:CR=1 FL=1